MNSHSSQTTDHGAPSHSAGTTASESTAHNAESRYELPPIPGPKYEQVIHYIEQRYIIPGKPGDKLPTERMIQQNFGVSRQTVRSALKVLIERGLLYNVQGSGTYVAERTDATYIPRVDTFVDDMRRRGFEGSTRMIADPLGGRHRRDFHPPIRAGGRAGAVRASSASCQPRSHWL